jgi:hypothetical protein
MQFYILAEKDLCCAISLDICLRPSMLSPRGKHEHGSTLDQLILRRGGDCR